jgi:hypothetical protein
MSRSQSTIETTTQRLQLQLKIYAEWENALPKAKGPEMEQATMALWALLAQEGPFPYAGDIAKRLRDDPLLIERLQVLGIYTVEQVESLLKIGAEDPTSEHFKIWNVQNGMFNHMKSVFSSRIERVCQDRFYYCVLLLLSRNLPTDQRIEFARGMTRVFCNRMLDGDIELLDDPRLRVVVELLSRIFPSGSLSRDEECLIYTAEDITEDLTGKRLTDSQLLTVATRGRLMNAFELRYGRRTEEHVDAFWLGPSPLPADRNKDGSRWVGDKTWNGGTPLEMVESVARRDAQRDPLLVQGPPAACSPFASPGREASPFAWRGSAASSPQRASGSPSAQQSQRASPPALPAAQRAPPTPAPRAAAPLVARPTRSTSGEPAVENRVIISPDIIELIADRLMIVGQEKTELCEDPVGFYKKDGRMRDLRMLRGPEAIIALYVLFAVAASNPRTAAELHVWNQYGSFIVVDSQLSWLDSTGLFHAQTSPLRQHGFDFQQTPDHIQLVVGQDWARHSVTLQHKILEGLDVIGLATKSLERVVDALSAAIVFEFLPQQPAGDATGEEDATDEADATSTPA